MLRPILTIRGYELHRTEGRGLRLSCDEHRRTVEMDRFGLQTLGGPIALTETFWVLPVCEEITSALRRTGGGPLEDEELAMICTRAARDVGVRSNEVAVHVQREARHG